jgi:rhodanese-related sulfurtransferase
MNRKKYSLFCFLTCAFFLLIFSTNIFAGSGLNKNEIISLEDLRKRQLRRTSFLLLDARSQRSYDTGHIQGAKLPLTPEYYEHERLFREGAAQEPPQMDAYLAQRMAKYPKGFPIVTYCSTGCQAGAVLLFKLKRLGFTDVKVMEEGFQQWEEKGYPIQKTLPK